MNTAHQDPKPVLRPDAYFLSACNPLANIDQRDQEARAILMFSTPEVREGMQQAARRWRTLVGSDIPEEAESRFAELVEEYAFIYVLKAVNGDPNYPKVLSSLLGPPHQWMGLDVPGSRGSGGDGPDHTYSIIPIDYGARYEVSGRRFAPTPADTPYTLTGNTCFSMTLGSLDGLNLDATPDGRFTITLDPEPANGRLNHIQTAPDARYLLIRECRSDWRQVAAAHRVRRLDPPTRPPLTDEQIIRRAVLWMNEDVPALFWFMRNLAVLQPNEFLAPFNTGSIGGLVSQKLSFGRLQLEDDEALVVTADNCNAGFRDLALHNFWFNSIEYWNNTSTMNNSQSVSNSDGTTTYVISIADPGVHNWVSTVGLHELLAVHRWQVMPLNSKPSITSCIVKLDDLDAVLPVGTRRITSAQRTAQLAERFATFSLRYADN